MILTTIIATISFTLGVLISPLIEPSLKHYVVVPRTITKCYEVLYNETDLRNTREISCTDTINMEKFKYE